MSDLDKEIEEARRKLQILQDAKKANAKKRTTAKILRPKGRPPINPTILIKALALAKEFPLPDVALQLNISLSTLYNHRIKRYILNREKVLGK